MKAQDKLRLISQKRRIWRSQIVSTFWWWTSSGWVVSYLLKGWSRQFKFYRYISIFWPGRSLMNSIGESLLSTDTKTAQLTGWLLSCRSCQLNWRNQCKESSWVRSGATSISAWRETATQTCAAELQAAWRLSGAHSNGTTTLTPNPVAQHRRIHLTTRWTTQC